MLRSGDTQDWRQVGAVLERRPSWAADDFWAPELVRRSGRALVYYAALARDGRRCLAVATSERVRGPYRDEGPLLCSRIGEIDPLPVTDEQGADWLVWKQDGNSRGRPTPILAAPLAPGGLALAGVPRELFRADAPWERGLVEGPALLRHDGMFYLVYSAGHCCGPQLQLRDRRGALALAARALGEAPRARSSRTARPSAVPGHVGVAGAPGGGLLLAYHAYARGDPANRQFLIAPLRFDAEGWPAVGPATNRAAGAAPVQLDFGGARPRPGLAVAGRPAAVGADRGGALRLGRGVLARQAGTGTFSARTRREPAPGAARGPDWR